MPQGELEPKALAGEVAAALLARRDWRLVPLDEMHGFAAEVARDAEAQLGTSRLPLPALLERLTVTHYCQRWHAACLAPAGDRQQRAWLELLRHVRRVVRHFLPPAEVEDAAQAVLLRVYEGLGSVEAPGALLRWVDQVARNWCIDRYRRAEPETDSLEDEVKRSGQFIEAPNTATSHAFEALLERCLRSHAQRQVIVGRVLHNRSAEHLAEELNTTPGNIRVLTHRALERLKTCDDFHAWRQAYQAKRADPDTDPSRSLRETRLPALTCAECQPRLPVYADLALAGVEAAAHDPAMGQHLRGCVACALALADLVELAEAEEREAP